VLNGMVRRALLGETLKIYGTGEFLRDYVFVDDVARAFLLGAAAAGSVNGRAFPVASGEGHTFAQAVGLVARLVSERTGREVRVEHVEPPPGLSRIENRSFVADPRALEAAIGFRAQISLEQGILRTIEYFSAEGRT
jgi:UDP-glucose 4-epimerase